MQREIFISYSRKDLSLVKQIKEEIDNAISTECWMDLNGIESGSPQFTKDIVDGINNCKVFLFMLSKHSQESEFALRELNYAYQKKKSQGKRVVIINISGCQLTDEFEFMYGLTDTILWSNEPQHDKLIGDLKKWLNPISNCSPEDTLGKFLGWSLDSEYYYICYSSPNIRNVYELLRCIENEGIHVWDPFIKKFPSGIDRHSSIKIALEHANSIVLLLSRYSAESRLVSDEMDYVIQNHMVDKMKIVYYENISMDHVWPELPNLIAHVKNKYNFFDITTSNKALRKFLKD